MQHESIQLTQQIASRNGVELNQNNGFYNRGHSYGLEKKLVVATAYQREQELKSGGRPSLKALALECNVGWHFVHKVEKELDDLGRVLHPSEISDTRSQNIPIGPGALTLDDFDQFVLLQLYLEEPSRTLPSYRHFLYYFTGCNVSESTISRFFNHAFPIRGGFVRPNLIPYDKFRPANIERAKQYLQMLYAFAPQRVKFCDEKGLKGQEIFNRKVRRNVLTGEKPPIITTPDFRNSYSITGFCGIDPTSPPLHYRIHDGTNTSEEFTHDIELAVFKGFLKRGDVLVLDNAPNHCGKDNANLEDWLWECFGVFALFLPTRTPEWNPIELVWNTLVQRLKTIPLSVLRQINQHCVALAAEAELDKFTHDDIYKFYRHCYKEW